MKVGDCVRLTEEGYAAMREEWPPEPCHRAVYPPAGAVGYIVKRASKPEHEAFVRFIGGYHNGTGLHHIEVAPGWWLFEDMLELVS